jgi:epoxyqueuosine reductase
MQAENIVSSVYRTLKENGFKSKIVSIKHVDELQSEIETHHQKGCLDEKLFDNYLADFDFKLKESFPDARSLIIVTAPQPQVRVPFRWLGRVYPCIIPPTYRLATDRQIEDCLNKRLKPAGFHLEIKKLPLKLLSVCSGLARYGKNNITYVPGMGSFHRPVAFVSDLPCLEDNWREASILKTCEGCTACMDACPTGAISSDRFLLYAEHCITFRNEQIEEFPHWLNPSWHNCLVGCMYCQKACPMNRKFTDWIVDGMVFDERETDFLLNASPEAIIPEQTVAKLEKLGMAEYAGVLGRNLKVLIEAQRLSKKRDS